MLVFTKNQMYKISLSNQRYVKKSAAFPKQQILNSLIFVIGRFLFLSEKKFGFAQIVFLSNIIQSSKKNNSVARIRMRSYLLSLNAWSRREVRFTQTSQLE